MRITGGQARGRKIFCPPGLEARPTLSKVRQALFNILGNRIVNSNFLDLCAGSGLIGIEALSRSASSLVFVDNNRKMIKNIEMNLKNLGYSAEFICADLQKVLPVLEPNSFDLVYADPPYKSNLDKEIIELISKHEILRSTNPHSLLVVEHLSSKDLPNEYGKLNKISLRKYGQTCLSFYSLSKN